jgi:CO/xanthine dehydrogenase FAD-binding subunit
MIQWSVEHFFCAFVWQFQEKVQKNAHFIENFAFPPPMPPAKKIVFFSRRRADYGFFFVNLSAKYELFFQ